MMARLVLRLIPLYVYLAGTTLFGAELGGVSTSIHNHYTSPRALGMGNAFVAVANDYSTLFYNPAGLARLEEKELNLSLDGGLSASYFQLARDLKSASNTAGTDTEKQLAIAQVIEANYGKVNGVRTAPASGILVDQGWGIGLIPVDLSIELTMNRSVGPAMNATIYGDTTLGLGWAKDVFWIPHSRLSLGVTGKFVNRLYYSRAINFIELAANSDLFKKENFREGYTFDADLGALWTPELPPSGFFSLFRLARPSFGAVLRNAAEMRFRQSFKFIQKQSSEAPEPLFRVLDVGTKWEYPRAWIFSGRGVMDFKNIMHPAYSFRKGFHLGFEFDWVINNFWKGAYRAGFNQGYLTAGASAKLLIFNADVVTYGEDVGTYSTPKENRVYMARLNLNF
jgi:hypothetical protein